MKWLVVALCLVQFAQFSLANGVPVFVFGDTSYKASPVLSADATSNLDTVLADESAKVIFVDSQLTSDDFNYCSFEGAACFEFLGRQSSKFYSPSIESPLTYLRTRVWDGAVRSVNADEDFSVAAGETVFVHFRDSAAHPTQNDRLAFHDSEIARTVTRLGDKGITYVYTAIEDHSAHKRVARQAEATPLLSQGVQYIIRMTGLATAGNNGADEPVDIPLASVAASFVKVSETTATITLSTPTPLKFDITQDGGRWWVETLTYGTLVYSSATPIGSNDGFSFACSPSTMYRAEKEPTRLVISGLQLQVDLNRSEQDNMIFGEAWNCVGFTSAGIWGGLFVTILLLLIMTIGISWMLDINTMDRFDDPKGKTITINAQE